MGWLEAGTQIASQGLNAVLGYYQNKQNYEYQQEMMRQQYEYDNKAFQEQAKYNEALIRDERNYNSPFQQMKRLSEAGLNPNMVYGSGSVSGNTTSSVTPAKVPTQQAVAKQATEYLFDLGTVLGQYYDAENKKLENELLRENIDKLRNYNEMESWRDELLKQKYWLGTYNLGMKRFDWYNYPIYYKTQQDYYKERVRSMDYSNRILFKDLLSYDDRMRRDFSEQDSRIAKNYGDLMISAGRLGLDSLKFEDYKKFRDDKFKWEKEFAEWRKRSENFKSLVSFGRYKLDNARFEYEKQKREQDRPHSLFGTYFDKVLDLAEFIPVAGPFIGKFGRKILRKTKNKGGVGSENWY